MKKCPACNRTYTDQTLSFCLDDGSLLNDANDMASISTRIISAPPPTNPGTYTPFSTPFADNQSSPPRSSKTWIIFPIIGLLAVTALGGIGLVAVFKDQIFGKPNNPSVYTIANVNNNSATKKSDITNINRDSSDGTPTPTPPATAEDLLGKWQAIVVEENTTMTLFVNFKADGRYDFTAKDKQGRSDSSYGTWRFSDNILYQTFSTGGSGKGSIRFIDKDTAELTIIDNGVPAYKGVKRIYRRIK